MEQNRPRDLVVAVEYCHRCNREPLCASCTNYEWGVDLRDRRWWLLTLNAMTVVPRTVARIERALRATCCICMGILGTEHDNPERPESISHGRPEGWTTCSSCTFTRVDLGGGCFYWQHSCPNDRPPRTHSRSGREGLRVGANNGCAIEGTVGNGMAQSDPTLDSGGPPLATRSDGNPCAIGLDGTGAVAELPSTSQRPSGCTEAKWSGGRSQTAAVAATDPAGKSAVLIRLTLALLTSRDVEDPWVACSREVNSEVDGREAAIPWATCLASNRACRRTCAKGGGYVRQCSPQDQ